MSFVKSKSVEFAAVIKTNDKKQKIKNEVTKLVFKFFCQDKSQKKVNQSNSASCKFAYIVDSNHCTFCRRHCSFVCNIGKFTSFCGFNYKSNHGNILTMFQK